MAIRKIEITRIQDQTTINSKYFDENGNLTVFSWQSPLPADYWISAPVSEYDAVQNARNGIETPGYKTVDKTTYEGRVLSVYSATERIMSDVWEEVTHAVVYSPETKGQKVNYQIQETDYLDVVVGCTGNYMQFYSAKVDAPEDIIKKWKFDCEQATIRQQQAQKEADAKRSRSNIANGKIVKVIKGRKVKKGTIGFAFWNKQTQYGVSVGIALTNEKVKKGGREIYKDVVFVAMENLEVVGADSALGMAVATWAWDTGRIEDVENYLELGTTLSGWDVLKLDVANNSLPAATVTARIEALFGLPARRIANASPEELAQAQAILAAHKAAKPLEAR